MKNLLFAITDLTDNSLAIPTNTDYTMLLGFILMNRMGGVCFNKLSSLNLLSEMPKEFKNTIRQIHEVYLEKNAQQKEFLQYFSQILSTYTQPYSLLKGSYLSLEVYPNGTRISNDFDILVSPEDLDSMKYLLLDNGFEQGFLSHNNGFVKASRKQIIESRMQNGETVPFVKLIGSNAMLVDVNFSLDYKAKTDKDIVKHILSATQLYKYNSAIQFYTLNKCDFLIHLCCHLYKEATTYNWVENSTDLTLYKFSDINVFIHKYGNIEYFTQLVERIKYFELEKECYYTFENSSIIYPNLNRVKGFEDMKESIRPLNLTFMKQVVYPSEKKLFQYDMCFFDWFFCKDHLANLKEIPNEAG